MSFDAKSEARELLHEWMIAELKRDLVAMGCCSTCFEFHAPGAGCSQAISKPQPKAAESKAVVSVAPKPKPQVPDWSTALARMLETASDSWVLWFYRRAWSLRYTNDVLCIDSTELDAPWSQTPEDMRNFTHPHTHQRPWSHFRERNTSEYVDVLYFDWSKGLKDGKSVLFIMFTVLLNRGAPGSATATAASIRNACFGSA